jgi:hypothetical protein
MTVTTGARGRAAHPSVDALVVEEGIGIVELGGKRLVAHFLDDDHRRFLIEHLVDGHHRAHLHQRLDHLGRLDGHLVGKIGDRDGLRHMNLVNHRLEGQLEGMLLHRRCYRDCSACHACCPASPSPPVAPRVFSPGRLLAPSFFHWPFLSASFFLLRQPSCRCVAGFRRRLVQGLVFRRPFARGLCGNLLGSPGCLGRDRLFFGILLQARQVGGCVAACS